MKKWTRLIMIAMSALMLTGCVYDYELSDEACGDTAPYYLTLRVRLAADGTRADEDSEHPENSNEYDNRDGQINGSDEENSIRNLTFFFVDRKCEAAKGETGLPELSQKDLPFVAALYVSPGNLQEGVTYDAQSSAIKIAIEKGKTISDRYAVTAVANMGDLSAGNPGIENIFRAPGDNAAPEPSDNPTGITSLHKLRKLLVDKVWDSTTDGTATNFRMSAIDPKNGGVLSTVNIGNGYDGSESNPFSASCYLMRLAARIDLGCSEKEEVADASAINYGLINSSGEVEYDVYDKGSGTSDDTKEKIGTIYLTGVEIFNRLQENEPNVFTFRHSMTKETAEKLPAGNDKLSATTEGMVCGGILRRNNSDKQEMQYVVDPYIAIKSVPGETIDAKTSDYYDNRYAQLKQRIKEDDPIIFSADLKKLAKNRTDDYDKHNGFNRTLTLGYVKENTYVNSRFDLQSATAGKQSANSNYATGLALRTVFVPKKVYTDTDCKNEASYAKGQTFHMWHKTDNGKEQRIFFSTFEAANSYKKDKAGGTGEVLSYENGIGYHELFIEHAYKTAPDLSPMKHGIVRNNVYRILLTFSGPGNTHYSETIQDVEWHIYTRDWNVREWNMREDPEIVL